MEGTVSLRDEIQEMMRRPVEEQGLVVQSFFEGRPIPASLEDGMQILSANIEGINAAVMRLAEEIDALRGRP